MGKLIKKDRIFMTVTVDPITSRRLDEMVAATGTPKGKIIDRLLIVSFKLWQHDMIDRIEEISSED